MDNNKLDSNKECQFCTRYPGDGNICGYTIEVVTYNTNPIECAFYTLTKNKKDEKIKN